MHTKTYRLVVASILYSEQDKRVGCRPYELLEYLQQAVDYDDEEHNAIVSDIEHSTRFNIEIRLSCEKSHFFIVTIQQDRSDDRRFHSEHYLEANSRENYFLDIGESTNRLLTVCRAEEENASRTLSTKSDVSPSESPIQTHKMRKSSSFLKRLRRNRSDSLYQISLSNCTLDAWNQHSLCSIVPNSVITFRILRNSKNIPSHQIIVQSKEICDDFFELTKCIIYMEARLQCERYNTHEYQGDLGGAADAILYHSFNFSNLPYVYRRIMILGVFLEWTHDKISLNERAVSYAITQLRTSSHIDIDKCFLASCRLSLAADHFIRKTLHSAHAIRFFPPIAHNSLMEFGRKIELAMSMRNLELWRHFPSHSPFESFGDELRQIIHDEVVIWIEEQYELDLPKSVRSISYSLSLLAEPYISFFRQFDISYIQVIFSTLDNELCRRGKRFIRTAINQLNPHNDESLEAFTKSTMKLFDGFKNIVLTAKDARVEGGDLFFYETWFTQCVIFWTYTWRTMCRNLTLRALDEDNDTTYDERVLPSCVNFLAVHKALYEDFSRLQLRNTSTALMCVLKIALTVADDLLLYAKQMKAENHRFDSNKRMLAANSIDHICKFVQNNTSRLLGIDALLMSLAEAESYQANSTLHQILSNTVEQCKSVSIWIVTSLCEERSETIAKHCHSITQVGTKRRKNLEWLRAVLTCDRMDHYILAYLDRFCVQINTILFPRLSVHAHQQILQICERSILESLQKGQPPAYYHQVQCDYEMIRRIVQADEINSSTSVLMNALYLNSSSTKELIQQYYTQLADRSDSTSLQTSMPHIRIRIGYVPTTNQRVIIQIDVLGASNLPILDHLAKTCDAYCRIEVLPHIIFPLEQFQAQTTMIQKETHNPTWDEHFQLMVNEDCFYMNGSVLCLSVLEHEVLGYNDLVGQGFVQLSRIPRLISFSKKHRAAITRLPLLLPTKEQFIGPFQVLVERSAKDVTAKAMCDYERYLHDYHMLPPYADRSNTTRILRRRSTFKKLMMHAHIRRSATTILTSSS